MPQVLAAGSERRGAVVDLDPKILKAIREGAEAAEALSDLLDALDEDQAQIVYPCRTHEDGHRNGGPLIEVTHVDFNQLVQANAKVTLKCCHLLCLPDGMTSGKGEYLPCVWCAEDCHS